jgi:hypothetical protein
VEHGAQHLVALGILEANSQEAEWIIDHFENMAFLYSGYANRSSYSEEENQADWFNKGGFSKYYSPHSRIVKIYSMRDEVKPLIRSVLNQPMQSLDVENLSLWEHGVGAAWNKTHFTGRMLAQIRLMFINDREDELWLAPFLPNHYMDDGEVVAVHQAPTHFGIVNYKIISHIADGYIDAEIDPPRRKSLKVIVIRIRHPEGKYIKSVIVNGKLHHDFVPTKEIIRIRLTSNGLINVRAEY